LCNIIDNSGAGRSSGQTSSKPTSSASAWARLPNSGPDNTSRSGPPARNAATTAPGAACMAAACTSTSRVPAACARASAWPGLAHSTGCTPASRAACTSEAQAASTWPKTGNTGNAGNTGATGHLGPGTAAAAAAVL
jgi:hypothetical protein